MKKIGLLAGVGRLPCKSYVYIVVLSSRQASSGVCQGCGSLGL